MHNDLIDNFLSGYTTPVADDGFSALIMAKADAKVAQEARLRRRVINGAFFVGGLAAAVQVPKLWGLLMGLNLPTLSLPKMDMADRSIIDAAMLGSHMSYTIAASLAVAVFTLWVLAADQLG